MPTRTLAVDGKTWLVFPSGRVTQYDRDEFGIIFVQRHRRRTAKFASRATRRSGARSREQSLVELSDADLAAPVRLLAAERHVARSRLHGVTATSPAGDGAAAFVDLHSHSTASDGSRAPRDVVVEAKRVGLAAIALTDHDTLDGVAEARRDRARARRARRAGRRAQRGRGRRRDAHPRTASVRHARARGAARRASRHATQRAPQRIVDAAERARRADRVQRGARAGGGRRDRSAARGARDDRRGLGRRFPRRVRPLSRQRPAGVRRRRIGSP